jgi:signal transduction histidine kinase
MIRELRETRMAETEREQIDGEARADCLRLIVHDLNNPLTAIRILAEMSRDNATDPETRADMVDMLEAADFASALVEGLSSMVRIERRVDELTWFPIDLVELLRDMVDRPAFQAHVELDLPRELQIVGDRTALGRAITDVLVNGRKLADRSKLRITASDAPRVVVGGPHLRGSVAGPRAEVRVRHPAPAVPPALRARLFEAYGAVELRHGAIPVSAVGLAHARQMILGHQGQMDFEDGPGGAMDLVIRLPR